MDSPVDIAACPFCGTSICNVHQSFQCEYVQCDRCESTGPARKTRDEAITAWNDRSYPVGFALVPMRADQQICQVMQAKLREWPHYPFRVAPVYEAAIREAMKGGR